MPNSTVPTKNTGDLLQASEINNIVTAVNSKAEASRTLTINGQTFDLTTNRTWTVSAAITDGDKGDVVVSASGSTWTIDALSVTGAKIANATITVGKLSATGTASSTTFLRGDGAWATPAGGSLTDGDKGDIIVSSSGATWTIDSGVINTAKLADASVTDAKIVTVAASKITGTVSQDNLPPVDFSSIDFVNTGSTNSPVIRIAPQKQIHTTGSTVSATTGKKWLIVNPASILSTLTVPLPETPIDGQDFEVSFGGTITSGTVVTEITVSPSTGTTILGSDPGACTTADTLKYRYNSTNTKWYRLQ